MKIKYLHVIRTEAESQNIIPADRTTVILIKGCNFIDRDIIRTGK
jgi:hypothetical protein